MKQRRSILLLTLTLVIMFAISLIMAIPVFAVTSGTTGACTWSLDGTILTISGDGEMQDYIFNNAPWQSAFFTEVSIKEGVTSIGNNAFSGCSELTSITVPGSITAIGKTAFENCGKLTAVWYVGTVEKKENIVIAAGNDRLNDSVWHFVDFLCDPTCNECGFERTVIHAAGIWAFDDDDHWRACSVCGYALTREPHCYDDGCDNACNVCAKIRSDPQHVYDNTCDADCNNCGKKRLVLGHFYEDECAAQCSFCGERRIVAHNYMSDCNSYCTRCNRKRAAPHVFTDSTDQICDSCGAARPAYTVGDIDGNPGITLDDAIYLLYYVFFPEWYPVNQSVDYDSNGKEELDDAIYLLFHTYYPEYYPLYQGIYWKWPLPASNPGSITQKFSANHQGIDIDAGGEESKGKVPVLAAADGVVVRKGFYADWGNLVVIDHGNGYMTYYAHLDSISVSMSQTVSTGDEIGKVGATGKTDTVKLFFVLYAPVGTNGTSVRTDPLRYVKQPQ